VLRHRGRRSGTEYAIPVAVTATDTAFIIALPWGRKTDWVRNVRAAGGCTIRWKGRDHQCTDPTFVERDVALAAAKGLARKGIERQQFAGGFLQLQRSPTG
jgi:deazaflavin-dependent oxidoreductase (nitroreductase family)